MPWHLVNAVFELVGGALAARGMLSSEAPLGARAALAWSALWALQCVPYYLSVGDQLNAGLALLRALALAMWVLR